MSGRFNEPITVSSTMFRSTIDGQILGQGAADKLPSRPRFHSFILIGLSTCCNKIKVNQSQNCASFKNFKTSADIYCEIREIIFHRDNHNHKRDKTKWCKMCSKGSEIHGLFSRLTNRRPWIPEKDKITIWYKRSSIKRVSIKSWFLNFLLDLFEWVPSWYYQQKSWKDERSLIETWTKCEVHWELFITFPSGNRVIT